MELALAGLVILAVYGIGTALAHWAWAKPIAVVIAVALAVESFVRFLR